MGNKSKVIEALGNAQKVVEARLVRFFDEIEKTPPAPIFETQLSGHLLGEVRDLTLRGGKRLRAGLVVYGAALFEPSWPPKPSVTDAAAAIELLHTYFLIHDDIMDHDDVRRGGPAVHAALSQRFGDETRGRDFAILAGDLASSMYSVLIAELELDNHRYRRLTRVLAAMHLDVVHGQTLDMLAMASPKDIAVHKTASYTTMGPLAAGAALGGASEEEIEHLARVASPLGVAFQYRDDLLGTFGHPGATGKSSKSDLLEGKRTILIEMGLSMANPEQRRVIEAVLGNADAAAEKLNQARQALEECGAREASQQKIEQLVDEFVMGLNRPGYDPDAVEFLTALAMFIANRDT